MLMNATRGLAFDVLYSELIEWAENSPFFREYFDESRQHKSLFKKGIDIGLGSRGKDALGQATVGAIFSEINDMTVVHDQGTDAFDTIYTRMQSRFGGKGVPLIGHIILDSSNKGVKSFLDSRLEEKKKKKHNDYIVFRFAHWEAKWHLDGYSGKFFRVYAGDENRDPFLIDEVDRDDNGDLIVIDNHTEQGVVDKLTQSRIIKAPIEHYQEFKFNIGTAIRDLAGVSTYGTSSYLGSVELLNRAIDHINPVTKDVIVLDFFDQNQKLLNYIDIKTLAQLNRSPRFIHIDLGLKNDSTGISCSYLEGYKDVAVYEPGTGRKVINREPVFFNEWVMEIVPVPGHEVAIYKIKEFILEARSLGYNIKCVSTDGFQSSNLRQDLLLKGFNTELVSVDRTKAPYDLLKNAILEGRFKMADSKKAIREFMELEDVGPKYDHPADGSKDVIDAITGSVYSCSCNLSECGVQIDSRELGSALDSLSQNQYIPFMFKR